MRCSNCGKDVPFEGKVCPYCKVDKSRDKDALSLLRICMFVGALLGFGIGFAIHDGASAVVGIIAGGIAGAVVAGFLTPPVPKTRVAPTIQATHNVESPVSQLTPMAAGEKSDGSPVDSSTFDAAVSIANQESSLLASGMYRRCPHCAEVIKSEARVCRFCQRDI